MRSIVGKIGCFKSRWGEKDIINSKSCDNLLDFANIELFPYLKCFKSITENSKSIKYKIGVIFEFLDNRIANGHTLREVLDIRGAQYPATSDNDLKNCNIPNTPYETQQKVVSYLDEISQNMEKIKEIQKEKMQSLKALKATILDQAFKGEL